ncbi:U4/U6.U5 tri-snRNP-associated protein 1 [Auxenochlorella protothecoides]|uniref:U4/U6.U5 tri-snRNP-associated protein 1 n=1 Tax=Auxenochlorella protothecoides TaxID=3075 RepID=A0A087SAS8_AUXPR|nr:U4/U6.U5 tri-snRNP-associated protein 1 [Auxenochlorella protothecoides]KFM22832.1 U4/U6.U5 tri-snRNP-associated protein 1 [Auxenochlorella protothecoides]
MGDRETSANDGGGGEISMSTEETNRLRISLGLKPLSTTTQPSALKELEAGQERRKAAEDAEASKALVARLAQAKEKRRQEELLKSTKKLGETGDDIDNDTLQWIERSRRVEAERKRKQAAAKPIRAMNDSDEDEEEDAAASHTGADLAGFKVKHSVDDLEAGESVILTLEDRGILDDKGNLIDDEEAALENILVREIKQREKAYRDSGKVAKPLWEEDGRQRTLLDKYDEEEEQVIQLGGDGSVVATQKQQLQGDVNARLKAGLALLEQVKPASDYYTPEEMEQFKPKKTKKVRKLKKKALTAEELEALAESTAAAAAALNQVNYASLALRNADAQPSTADFDDDDDDAVLAASLQRERLRALKEGGTAGADPDSLADQLRQRRSRRPAAAEGEGPSGDAADQGLVFTGIGEITRAIQVAPGEPAEGSAGQGAAPSGALERMEVDEAPMPTEQPPPLPPSGEAEAGEAEPMDGQSQAIDEPRESGFGRWAPVSEGGSAEDAIKERIKAKIRPPAPKVETGKEKVTLQRDEVVGDRAIGAGMAGALAFLQSRGDLDTAVEWSGRTNDSKKVNIQGLDEVYSGGRTEDRQALSVENSKEKKRRKVEEEMARKRAASGAVESGALEQMKQVQRREAQPYVVISGTVRPGQSRDVVAGRGGYDPGDPDLDEDGVDPLAPRLGGSASLAPLTGNAKVAAMLGLAGVDEGGRSVSRGKRTPSRGARGS